MTVDRIETDIGCAGYGANFVRGRRTSDLLGEATRWSIISRMIGGPALSLAESRFLDDVTVAIFAPDPRIWPLKVTWLAGAYGDWWAAMATSQAMLAEARMGPWACAAAAPTAAGLAEVRDQGEEGFEARAVEWARGFRRRREVLWGFGVAGGAGRKTDERIVLIDRACRAHGRHELRCYRAAMDGAKAIAAASRVEPNMALPIAALALDLGFVGPQIEALMFQIVEPQVLGNAWESARLRPSVLRRLPDETIRFRGRAPRRSPRSIACEERDEAADG